LTGKILAKLKNTLKIKKKEPYTQIFISFPSTYLSTQYYTKVKKPKKKMCRKTQRIKTFVRKKKKQKQNQAKHT